MTIRDESLVSDIRIGSLVSTKTLGGKLLKLSAPGLDRLLGIRAMRRIYEENDLAGLDARNFARRVLECLGVKPRFTPATADVLPTDGPVLMVCNHPFGGMEAVILIQELLKIRPDLKVLGNTGLKVFRELEPVMIYTNPLTRGQRNLPSLRQALAQLRAGGLLVIFPAGRVSYIRKDLGRVADHNWDRVVGHLLNRSAAALVPAHFSGTNSQLFLTLGAIVEKLKILMLPREMLKLNNRTVDIHMGLAVENKALAGLSSEETTRFARLVTYLQSVKKELPPPLTSAEEMAPLGEPPDVSAIEREIDALPERQRLIEYKGFVVCFGTQEQLPATVYEIARQRERTFRLYDEGSGEPIDTDYFDATYVHLFVWNRADRALLGAYRMGQTDKLHNVDRIYLHQMFNFDDAFYTEGKPSLELGRSFVTPEYQKHHTSLHLLWRGIGAYLRAHPRYRRLYGTVSLSRQYDLRSICAMCDGLIEPTQQVAPKHALDTDLGPEWQEYKAATENFDLKRISLIVRSLESDGKDIPVLLRHYHKVGAKFLAVGVDTNFNNTPGLLLSVDIDTLPERKRRLYVDE